MLRSTLSMTGYAFPQLSIHYLEGSVDPEPRPAPPLSSEAGPISSPVPSWARLPSPSCIPWDPRCSLCRPPSRSCPPPATSGLRPQEP